MHPYGSTQMLATAHLFCCPLMYVLLLIIPTASIISLLNFPISPLQRLQYKNEGIVSRILVAAVGRGQRCDAHVEKACIFSYLYIVS